VIASENSISRPKTGLLELLGLLTKGLLEITPKTLKRVNNFAFELME